MKNYYEILKVPLSASDEDIKSSYRKLAKKFHPDVCRNENQYPLFNIITNAYKVLSNKKERLKYNEKFLKLKFQAEKEIDYKKEKKIIVTYSRSLGILAKRGFFLSSIPKQYRDKMDLKYDVEVRIDYWDAQKNGMFEISVPTKLPCPDCNGLDHYCKMCDGKNYIVRATKINVLLPKAPQSGEIFEVDLTKIKKGRLAVIRANKLRIKVILTHTKTNYRLLKNIK